MSRRRKAPRPLPARWRRITIKCHGPKGRPHSSQRVATVEFRLAVDETEVGRIRVDYGGLGEPPSETGAARLSDDGDPHMTRRFVCHTCQDDLPVRDDKLIEILASHGEPSLQLGALRAKVS